MPLPMVHLMIAERLVKAGIPVKEESAFYLGAIAPDAIHAREGYHQELKLYSHINARTLKNQENVRQFLQGAKESPHRDFLLGYAVHVLTDGYWLEDYWRVFYDRVQQTEEWKTDWKSIYYNDTDQIDMQLYEEYPRLREIVASLPEQKGVEVAGLVTAGEVEAWAKRTDWWYRDWDPTRYDLPISFMTVEEVQDFTSGCWAFCARFLQESGITNWNS